MKFTLLPSLYFTKYYKKHDVFLEIKSLFYINQYTLYIYGIYILFTWLTYMYTYAYAYVSEYTHTYKHTYIYIFS